MDCEDKVVEKHKSSFFTTFLISILVTCMLGYFNYIYKDKKTYEFAYKQIMKHDQEITKLIDDLNKFKTEELKQRKQRLLEASVEISEENEIFRYRSSDFQNILRANAFIHDEEIKLLREELDRLKQKLEAKK